MKRFYIGCGISGSGKSTFFKTFLPDACYLNADSIREELSGNASDQTVSKDAFKLLYERLYEDAGWDSWPCVIDNTSITAKSRQAIYDVIKKAAVDGRICGEYEIIVVWFSPQLDKAQSWNTNRQRVVPAHVIQSQYDRMEYPSEEEQKICKVYGVTI